MPKRKLATNQIQSRRKHARRDDDDDDNDDEAPNGTDDEGDTDDSSDNEEDEEQQIPPEIIEDDEFSDDETDAKFFHGDTEIRRTKDDPSKCFLCKLYQNRGRKFAILNETMTEFGRLLNINLASDRIMDKCIEAADFFNDRIVGRMNENIEYVNETRREDGLAPYSTYEEITEWEVRNHILNHNASMRNDLYHDFNTMGKLIRRIMRRHCLKKAVPNPELGINPQNAKSKKLLINESTKTIIKLVNSRVNLARFIKEWK